MKNSEKEFGNVIISFNTIGLKRGGKVFGRYRRFNLDEIAKTIIEGVLVVDKKLSLVYDKEESIVYECFIMDGWSNNAILAVNCEVKDA